MLTSASFSEPEAAFATSDKGYLLNTTGATGLGSMWLTRYPYLGFYVTHGKIMKITQFHFLEGLGTTDQVHNRLGGREEEKMQRHKETEKGGKDRLTSVSSPLTVQRLCDRVAQNFLPLYTALFLMGLSPRTVSATHATSVHTLRTLARSTPTSQAGGRSVREPSTLLARAFHRGRMF